ncbi:MAG: hypothetical protein ITG00_09890 [Flavobacterium sp.]|nr:hypothetical protein [Flavobacterium sp.]
MNFKLSLAFFSIFFPLISGGIAAVESRPPLYFTQENLEATADRHSADKNWETAAELYQKLIAKSPNTARYHYKYGGALAMVAQSGNKFKALTLINDIRGAFEKTIEIEPSHIEARWALIEYYIQLPVIAGGSEEKAVSYAAQLANVSPVDGWLANGHIAEFYERYQSAEQYYKKAIALGKSKTAYQKLADLYKNKMAQPEKAAAVMKQFQQAK